MSRTVLLLALASAVLPVVAEKVRVDYDHGCDYSHYKTYRWAGFQRASPSDVQFPNQLMRERIVRFVDQALAARHFTRVETGGDLLVNYDVKVTAEPQLTTFTNTAGPFGGWDGWGWGSWGWGGWGWAGWGCCGWGSGFSTTTAQTYWEGTLVVSLTDSHRNQLVFQGASTEMISSRAGKNTKRLQKGVNEIFEKYPPN
jgi:Domain of unknown function (DUF4136)